jgi:hypothetical protein
MPWRVLHVMTERTATDSSLASLMASMMSASISWSRFAMTLPPTVMSWATVRPKMRDVELLADLVGVGAGDDVGLLRSAILFTDDGVLHGVDEAAREVTGFGGLESGVGLTFASTVRGDEELEHREALLEVGLDRKFDGAAGRVGDQTLHGAELGDWPQLPRAPESMTYVMSFSGTLRNSSTMNLETLVFVSLQVRMACV